MYDAFKHPYVEKKLAFSSFVSFSQN